VSKPGQLLIQSIKINIFLPKRSLFPVERGLKSILLHVTENFHHWLSNPFSFPMNNRIDLVTAGHSNTKTEK